MQSNQEDVLSKVLFKQQIAIKRNQPPKKIFKGLNPKSKRLIKTYQQKIQKTISGNRKIKRMKNKISRKSDYEINESTVNDT
jgi:hypothetical protein